MGGNRSKLRNFYLALCVSQMAVMAMGLTTAYQVERSYSQNIEYERIVNAERQRVDELEVLVHAASPEAGVLDDNASGPDQLSEVAYGQCVREESAGIPGTD